MRAHEGLHFGLCQQCIEELEKGECTHEDENARALVGTWVTAEVDAALARGYKLVEIKEVFHWEKWHSEFYKEFIRTFMQIKVSLFVHETPG